MNLHQRLNCWLTSLALAAVFHADSLWASEVPLAGATILVDPAEPSYVQYAVEELAGYLQEASGVPAAIQATNTGNRSRLIAVGAEVASQITGKALDTENLGDEGFVLRCIERDGKTIVVAAGAKPRGTKAAIGELMKRIEVAGKTPSINAPLDIRSRPSFAKRGMHFNGWPFGYPYTFRGWREADWQRYLDILAYQGVNLFYLWPFMEIMPLPLSPEDQAYLAECRRIVDYAHEKHGMEVWIMHCTNRVAQDRCGVDDPKKRPYWRPSQKDLNPGDPSDFQAIMASRAALYQAINNADGFCNIDSDPGYYVGSPLEDYVKVLQGCRELLDKHTLGGKQTKLIDWMWIGWGIKHIPHARNVEHQDRTLGELKQHLTEPWGLLSGEVKYLAACRKHGVLDKTILLQYGMIEAEPAYPHTNVAIDSLRSTIDAAFVPNTDILGLMGNMQTPLLQFPHMYYFTSSMWNLDSRQISERDTLLAVARLLYPEHRDLIADCYAGLKSSDADHVEAMTSQLDPLIQQDGLGRLGVFGRKLFPDRRIVAKSLVYQLKLRSSTERLMQVSADTPQPTCVAAIRDCLDASLAWGQTNGWPALWGKRKPALEALASDPRFAQLPVRLARCLKDVPTTESTFNQIVTELSQKYDPTIVEERGARWLRQKVIEAIKKP